MTNTTVEITVNGQVWTRVIPKDEVPLSVLSHWTAGAQRLFDVAGIPAKFGVRP